MRYAAFVGVIGFALAGCLQSQLSKVAALDLDCPEARVDVESPNVAHASGCGKRLTYRRSCEVATLTGRGPVTVCRWMAGGSSSLAESTDYGWDSQYRPAARVQASTPTTTAATSSSPTPTPENVPTHISIADLGDLTKAEAEFRKWIGQSVRLALADGTAFEGVLQYVRSYTLWFTDGTQHRLEDVLAAERP